MGKWDLAGVGNFSSLVTKLILSKEKCPGSSQMRQNLHTVDIKVLEI